MANTKIGFNQIRGAVANVMDFGAVADSNGHSGVGTNNSAAFQAALDSLSGNGGRVYVPHGNYRIATALHFNTSIILQGESAESAQIYADGCDAIHILSAGTYGPGGVHDIGIRACDNTGLTFTGISAPGTTALIDRTNGLSIQRCEVWNFLTALYMRTVWQSNIRDNQFLNNINGIVAEGQCIKVNIENNSITHWLGILPGTTSYGFLTQAYTYGTGAARCEDIQLQRNLVYGFDWGCSLQGGLFLTVADNDFDATKQVGIEISSLSGTTNIIRNWVGGTGAIVDAAIKMIALGTPTNNVTNIIGNELNSIAAGTTGIYIGSNRSQVNIEGNSIGSGVGFGIDIALIGCSTVAVKGNACNSNVNLSLSASGTAPANRTIKIEDNFFNMPIALHPTNNLCQFIFGANSGLYSTMIRGASTIIAGNTSAATSYASLPTQPANFPLAATYGYKPELFIGALPTNQGAVFGTAALNAVTVFCTAASTANITVPWEVRAAQMNNST